MDVSPRRGQERRLLILKERAAVNPGPINKRHLGSSTRKRRRGRLHFWGARSGDPRSPLRGRVRDGARGTGPSRAGPGRGQRCGAVGGPGPRGVASCSGAIWSRTKRPREFLFSFPTPRCSLSGGRGDPSPSTERPEGVVSPPPSFLAFPARQRKAALVGKKNNNNKKK